ncbi:10375_t:CDS:2, partial [Dentiscutata erythropus]
MQLDNSLIRLLSSIFQVLEKICRQEVNNQDAVKLDSKKVAYSYSLELCKKALDIAIKMQVSNQKNIQELFEQEFMISNSLQYKGRSHPLNKRCLLAIENHSIKNVCSNNQDETLASGSMKKTSSN